MGIQTQMQQEREREQRERQTAWHTWVILVNGQNKIQRLIRKAQRLVAEAEHRARSDQREERRAIVNVEKVEEILDWRRQGMSWVQAGKPFNLTAGNAWLLVERVLGDAALR